jgi:hypothetical protein
LSGKGDLTSVDNARYPMVKPTHPGRLSEAVYT